TDNIKFLEKIEKLELRLKDEQTDNIKFLEKIKILELTLYNEETDNIKSKKKIKTLELTLNDEQTNNITLKESIQELKSLLKKKEITIVSYQNKNQYQLVEQKNIEKQLITIKLKITKLLAECKIAWEENLEHERVLKQRGIDNFKQFHTLFIKYTGVETRLEFRNNLKSKKLIRFFRGNREGKFKIIENKFNRIPFKFIENFNQEAYLNFNEKVKDAVNDGSFDSALEHFIFFGFDEVLRGDRMLNSSVPYYEKKIINRTNKDMEYDFIKYLESSTVTSPIVAEEFVNLKVITEIDKISYNKNINMTSINKKILVDNRTIDIILPIYNALEDVKNCINSLYQYKTFDFNLIAIDDCSDLETKVYLEKESVERGFKLLRNKENLRFTKTVNRGFLESKADFVVLLNSDTIVTQKWIEKILACFDSNKKIGIVGPLSNAASWQTVPVRNDKEFGGWLVNEIPNRYTIEEMGLLVETLSTKIYPKVPSVNGFCYVIKREVLDINGSLDEEYFPTGYGEEDDFSIRAKDAGFEIAVADDTYIFHAKSKSYTHEVRAVLTQGGRKSLDKKHGEKRIKKLINDWKTEPLLPQIGKHIESYMQISTKNKKVVYTAIFGNYDSIKEPEYINEDWDYICFTNNKNLKSKTFKIKYVDAIFENQTKNARMIKILSHIFLIGYDYSLWIDGNVKLRGENIEELVENNKIDDYISLHQHVKRECIFDEVKACIAAKKDNSAIMLKQLDNYEKEGMPKRIGLVETAEILRQENNKKTRALNLLWWKELNENSIRDQLSFNYVCWKNDFHYSVMKGIQWLDPYFNIYKHGLELSLQKNPEVTIIIVIEKEDSLIIEAMIENMISITQYSEYKVIVTNTIENLEIDRTLIRLKELYPLVDIMGNCKGRSILDAKNYIVEKMISPYICFIDVYSKIIEGNWLSLLVAELVSNDCAVMAGPTILDRDYKFLSSAISIKQKKQTFLEAKNRRLIGGTGTVYAISDKCILVKKEAFIKVKKFSNKLDSQTATIDLSFKFLELNLTTKFVLNSQIIDTSTSFSEKEKMISSDKLRTIWGKSNILKKDISTLDCKKKVNFL
ncbi:MAG TPA: DUF616 domain-containing protein, partial [Flavobacteriaceae bacterium]|nr:DUF616 domain-containing protein [Flavobacteriaceae bacterium]